MLYFERTNAKLKTLLFLWALFLVAPLVCCNKKSTCIDDPLGGHCTPLPRYIDSRATWSPDGSTIAYYHAATIQLGNDSLTILDTSGIYLIDTTGKNKRLLFEIVVAEDPCFSANGSWVAFSGKGEIYKIKINRDSLTQLTFTGSNFEPRWSPSGDSILFTKRAGQSSQLGIWLMTKQGNDQKILIPQASYANWSKDGQQILCEVFLPDSQTLRPYLAVFNLTDSTFTKLRDLSKDLPSVALKNAKWNPIDNSILMTGEKLGTPSNFGGPFLYVTDSAGKSLIQLSTTWADYGTWSPTGDKIVFTDAQPNVGRLFLMDKKGGNKKQLTF